MRAQWQQPLQHDLDRAHLRLGHALLTRGDGVLGGDVDRDLGDVVKTVGGLSATRKGGEGKKRQGDARNS